MTIAHDYLCPWCWVGYFHALRLQKEFPQIKQNWVGHELMPEELGPIPDYKPTPPDPLNPTRFERFADREGVLIPINRTIGAVRTHSALEGAEWFKEHAPKQFEFYNGAVYRAYWERSEDISNLAVLGRIAEESGGSRINFVTRVEERHYHGKIVRFDQEAYAADVTHVPTFIFPGERCAEAPYETIKDLASRYLIWYDKVSGIRLAPFMKDTP